MDEYARLLNPLVELAEGGKVGAGILGAVLARTARKGAQATTRGELGRGQPGAVRVVDRHTISQGTISKAVAQLTKDGLLAGGHFTKEGSRAVEEIRLGSGFVTAAAHVVQHGGRPTGITTILCDVGGHRILGERTTRRIAVRVGEDPWKVLASTIFQHVTHLLDRLGAQTGVTPRLFGVGVEVGAPVIDGEVTTTDASTERTAPLAEYLRAEFTSVVASPYPGVTPAILVENDVACLAMLAFREYGYDTADLAVAAVLEDGIGGGLIMDGRLRRGHSGRAMEIGHLLVGRPPGWRAEHEGTDTDRDAAAARWVGKDDPLLCSCGMVDHVDAFATVASLRRDLEATEDDDLEAAAQRLDPHKAREILSRAGSCLGRALAHVCNVVDPGMLILYLPRELADVSGTRRTADYLEWVRIEVTQAFAVKGSRATEFNHQSLPTGKAELARLLARSAAVCLLDTVVEQALDYDEYRSDRKSVASRYEMTGAGGSSRRIPS